MYSYTLDGIADNADSEENHVTDLNLKPCSLPSTSTEEQHSHITQQALEFRKKIIATIHRRQRVRRCIGAILLVFSIIGNNIVILFIISNSSIEDANGWLFKYSISLGQDLLVIQFLKTFLQIWLIRRLARYIDEASSCRRLMLLLTDKLVLRALAA